MDKLEAARQQYADADASLRRRNLNNHPDLSEQQLYRAISALGTMVEALTARVTEVFVGNRVVRDGEGRLAVPRPYDFHNHYRRQPVE